MEHIGVFSESGCLHRSSGSIPNLVLVEAQTETDTFFSTASTDRPKQACSKDASRVPISRSNLFRQAVTNIQVVCGEVSTPDFSRTHRSIGGRADRRPRIPDLLMQVYLPLRYARYQRDCPSLCLRILFAVHHRHSSYTLYRRDLHT